MKNYFLCLCIFAKLWLKQKALSAFKTLYIHLYFSIYIFKDLILPKKPTHVQQHFVSILMEKAWSLKKRNLNKAQKRRLEILINWNQQSPHPIDFSFQKKSTRKKVQINATTATEPNCHYATATKTNPKYLQNY